MVDKVDKDILESLSFHIIRPEDLNHHGTMFAAQLSKWMIEGALIAACRLVGKPEDVVCVQVDRMTFRQPLHNGDLIRIKSKVAHLGSSSITIYTEVARKLDVAPVVTNLAIFVTIDKENKTYAHGLKLSEEYIADNRAIYDAALKIQGKK
jgi:acyl-CoA hydrolase